VKTMHELIDTNTGYTKRKFSLIVSSQMLAKNLQGDG
jgi:hypothetical protein